MKQFSATIKIHAPAEKIWNILLNTSAYPEWDPYCEKIDGRVALGEKIKAFSTLSPGRAFSVKVTEFVPHQKMVWSGGMPLGLFKGERTLTLTSNENGFIEFNIQEQFSGPMLRLIGRSIPDMTEPFKKFAEGLKQRAETVS